MGFLGHHALELPVQSNLHQPCLGATTMHTLSVHLGDVTVQREGVRHNKILRVKPYLDRHTYAEAFCDDYAAKRIWIAM